MDHHFRIGEGFLITLFGWIISHFVPHSVQDVASLVTITVGCITVFINWPNIKKRISSIKQSFFNSSK
jgi:hypothetical protein